MTKSVLSLGIAVMAIVSMSLLSGCGGGSGGGTVSSDDEFIGTWLEDRGEVLDAGTRGQLTIEPSSPNLRQITFAADHNFKMIVCKPDGSPASGVKEVTGSWEIEGGYPTFKVPKTVLSGKYKGWEPDFFTDKRTLADGAVCIELTHKNGERVLYKKKGG